MVTGFGFPKVGFHQSSDFRQNLSINWKKFSNGIRINDLIKNIHECFVSYFVKYKKKLKGTKKEF